MVAICFGNIAASLTNHLRASLIDHALNPPGEIRLAGFCVQGGCGLGADIGKIEYRVIPITRYTVTRYHSNAAGNSSGVGQCGEYNNEDLAYEVGYALAKAEHSRLGWPVGDERIKYPEVPGAKNVACVGRIGSGGLSI